MLVRESRGGLFVAENEAASREIRSALKRVDPDLVLAQEVDPEWSRFVWRVLLRQGDRPAVWLFDWRANPDDPRSEPCDLTFGIVEEAQLRMLGSRRPLVDPLTANDQLQQRLDEESMEDAEAIARETSKRARTLSPVQRSRGLYLSRTRARNRGRI